MGRWPAPALPPALLSPPETAARTGDRSQRSRWRGAGAHTPPPGAFAPHSRTTGDVARPARLRRSRGVRSFTFHFRESKCLVFEGALEKKRVVHTGDAEPLSPSGCPRLPGRRDPSIGGDPGQLPPGWARSRPKAPPKAACPGQEVGSEVAWALDRLRVCWPGRQETGCPARADGQHADLPRPSEPRTRPGQAAGAGGPGAAGGGVGDTGLPVWSERGLAAGRVGVGCDGAGPRLVLGCRHHVPPRPPEAVRVSASSSQTGLGTALGLHFTLVTSLKTPSTHSPVMRGGGASGAQVAPGDAVQPGTGHITRPEAPGLGQWGAQGHAGPFLGGRFSQEEVPGLRRQTGRPPTREGAGRSRGPPWGVGSPTTSYGAARLCG